MVFLRGRYGEGVADGHRRSPLEVVGRWSPTENSAVRPRLGLSVRRPVHGGIPCRAIGGAVEMAFARQHRCLDDLDVDGCEHGVEGGSELAVRSRMRNPNRRWKSSRSMHVAGASARIARGDVSAWLSIRTRPLPWDVMSTEHLDELRRRLAERTRAEARERPRDYRPFGPDASAARRVGAHRGEHRRCSRDGREEEVHEIMDSLENVRDLRPDEGRTIGAKLPCLSPLDRSRVRARAVRWCGVSQQVRRHVAGRCMPTSRTPSGKPCGWQVRLHDEEASIEEEASTELRKGSPSA